MGAVQRQHFLHTSAGALSVTQEAGVDTVVGDYSYILDLVAHLAALPSLVDAVDVYYMPLLMTLLKHRPLPVSASCVSFVLPCSMLCGHLV